MKKTCYIGAVIVAASVSLSAFSVSADVVPTCYYDEECPGYVIAGANIGETTAPGPAPSTPDPM